MTSYSSTGTSLRNSGFSARKSRNLIIVMVLLWIAAAMIFGFPLLVSLMLAGSEYGADTFGQGVVYLIGPAVVAAIPAMIALAIRRHIKETAQENIQRQRKSETNIFDGKGYIAMSPWTTEKGIELYPVLKKDGGHNFIFLMSEKPETLSDRDGEFNTKLAGVIEWDPHSGVIQNVTTHDHHQGTNWQRQGVATFLYNKARNVTPHLQHSEDARAWIKSLG